MFLMQTHTFHHHKPNSIMVHIYKYISIKLMTKRCSYGDAFRIVMNALG